MNSPALKVMFYVGRELRTARLVFKHKRAFVVLHQLEPRHTNVVGVDERIELDVECLEKMNPALGADYFYKNKVESPETSVN
jgi:hypothetical protein